MVKRSLRLILWCVILFAIILLSNKVVIAKTDFGYGEIDVALGSEGEELIVYEVGGEESLVQWTENASGVVKVERYVREMGVDGIKYKSDAAGIVRVSDLSEGVYYIKMSNPKIQSFLVPIPLEGSYVVYATPKIEEDRPPFYDSTRRDKCSFAKS